MSATLKRYLPLALVIGGCAPPPASLSDADRAAVVAEVTAALSELTAAMNAHDSEGVIRFYPEDPSFLYLGCTDFITGGATFRRMVAPYYGPGNEVSFEQQIVSVQVLSPTAAVASQRGSSSEAEALFWTQVLVKKDGRWVITYEHESWPDCSPPSAPHPFTAPGDSAGLLPGGIAN
jgi:ketosteroid isomerase-like protein